jgi:hypothetical protein
LGKLIAELLTAEQRGDSTLAWPPAARAEAATATHSKTHREHGPTK